MIGDASVDNGSGAFVVLSTEGAHILDVVFETRGLDIFQEASRLGTALSGPILGADGVIRIAVGAPGAFDGAGTFALFSLNEGLVLSGWIGIEGAAIGSDLASVGDLDQDGNGDLAVGLAGASLPDAQEWTGAHALFYGAW